MILGIPLIKTRKATTAVDIIENLVETWKLEEINPLDDLKTIFAMTPLQNYFMCRLIQNKPGDESKL